MSKSSLTLAEKSAPFLNYLEEWISQLRPISWSEAIPDPRQAAIVSVDVTNGFCHEGPLSSPRVARIVEPITRLFEGAWTHGVRHILLPQDTHDPQAVEFAQFPPHCVRGTAEAETVGEIKALPFFDQMIVMEKNSIASGLNTGLETWIKTHLEVDTFVVVGDCTDLCTYQLAMFLRLDANARQIQRRVIVAADGVDTYDYPLEASRSQGGLAHPGDLLHAVFLYHMLINGIEIVSEIKS